MAALALLGRGAGLLESDIFEEMLVGWRRQPGSSPLPGRRATLLQLAAQIPAAVLAELLNLTPGTATRWTRDAGGDWSRFAADLVRERDHQR